MSISDEKKRKEKKGNCFPSSLSSSEN